jgi:hypothetical protein
MEIRAVLEAVRALPGPLKVVSDSTYVVNCFRDRWWASWQRNGWRNSKKQPVANRDLWEPLVDLVNARGNVSFGWVKGHGTDPEQPRRRHGRRGGLPGRRPLGRWRRLEREAGGVGRAGGRQGVASSVRRALTGAVIGSMQANRRPGGTHTWAKG